MNYRNIIEISNASIARNIIGQNDKNLQFLEELFSCDFVYRDNFIKTNSDNPNIDLLFKECVKLAEGNLTIDTQILKHLYTNIGQNIDHSWRKEIITYTNSGKPIFAKTKKQSELCRLIQENSLVFSIGPAGTGKTFLAVVMAVKALKKGDVEKIILTRPAVEAGESLGFLPGDLKDKVDPYLMPLYDALDTLLGHEQVEKYRERGIIEIIPLAYMRGRTLANAFVILDEAQNTTEKQMMMFLTRLGADAKMVVNGDLTQIDLNIHKEKSGLKTAEMRLQNIDDIAFIDFGNEDVVRSRLVEKIVEAYQTNE